MKIKHLLGLAGFLLIASATASAQIALPQAKQTLKPQKKFDGPTPQLNLKPDLIIQNMGFSAEFCTDICSDTWARELQVYRVKAENCYWSVTVKNIGDLKSKPGKVSVQYRSLGGPVTLTGDMPAISPGRAANVVVPFNNARPRYLYYEFNYPFQAEADSTNTSAESNERNNTKSQRMTSGG